MVKLKNNKINGGAVIINIRNKIKVGNVVSYKNKIYIIIRIYFECGGNCMGVDLVKYTPDYNPIFKFVKQLYDEQIEELHFI